MGEVFARAVLGMAKPTSACSMSAPRSSRATTSVREASRDAARGELDIDYHGFVEGDDITEGTVDVSSPTASPATSR